MLLAFVVSISDDASSAVAAAVFVVSIPPASPLLSPSPSPLLASASVASFVGASGDDASAVAVADVAAARKKQ